MLSTLRRLYRRLRFGESIVVVSGLPRSGTSMIMKMLEAGGLTLVVDGRRTADEDNPKGYFEDERVKNLAAGPDKSWLTRARGKGIKIISHLLKELPATNNHKVLFIHRNLHEILASQSKMLIRRGKSSTTSDERMLELFENDLWKACYLLRHSPQFETLELHYQEVIRDSRKEAQRIKAFLGRTLDVARMAGVVDQNLYRNRSHEGPNL